MALAVSGGRVVDRHLLSYQLLDRFHCGGIPVEERKVRRPKPRQLPDFEQWSIFHALPADDVAGPSPRVLEVLPYFRHRAGRPLRIGATDPQSGTAGKKFLSCSRSFPRNHRDRFQSPSGWTEFGAHPGRRKRDPPDGWASAQKFHHAHRLIPQRSTGRGVGHGRDDAVRTAWTLAWNGLWRRHAR